MKHAFLDRYSNRKSIIHSWDPRIKIIVFFAVLLFIVTVNYSGRIEFLAYTVLVALLVLLSRIPIGFIVKRVLQILPFIALIAIFLPFVKRGESIFVWKGFITVTISREGLQLFQTTLIRGTLAIVLLVILINSMPFASFLKALQQLRVPSIFVSVMAFMYRFLFLVIDEGERLIRAKNSRIVKQPLKREMKTLGNIIGILFIRTYERSERVYQAMCARGFSGEIHILSDFHVRGKDLFLAAVFLAAAAGIKIFI